MSDETQAPQGEEVQLPDVLPVLPLRDAVLFPYIILPLSIGREHSTLAVDQALGGHRTLMLVGQRDPDVQRPERKDLYDIGTIASITRMLKLPDGRIRILVQGLSRARLTHLTQGAPYLEAEVSPLDDVAPTSKASALEREALMRNVRQQLEQAANLGKNVSPEVLVIVANLEDSGRLADLVASNLELPAPEAQELLEELDPFLRLRRMNDILTRELEVLSMQQNIASQARDEMDRSQRDYFLRQQLKAIQEELGEGDELSQEILGWRESAVEKSMPENAMLELEKQIKRLERSHPDSAEAATSRTYLDWLAGLPWGKQSDDNLDIVNARRVLDEDHYDLEKIKDRILEFLAVRQLRADAKGPILCFVGPPGVGKTSLGRSIARALGRQFLRLSLGGVRDEAEIRGHRRTYVGALPGRILQGINQAGTSNPVFMLDEIDKIGVDFRGDPSSALLEVLDPEQNHTFRDHYLSVEYDLSKVLFIATANLLEPIQPAFLDRMEVVRLSGYTAEDKLEIANRHLIPKLVTEHGLSPARVKFTDKGLQKIIADYTREAGLRNLEREIAAVCRKVAVGVAEGNRQQVTINPKRVGEFLGAPKHRAEELLRRDRIGVATGLAWTAVGGDLLFIEVVALPGKGKLLLTGQLGEVMKESAQAAVSFARAWAADHEYDANFFSENDLHIHVPAGSIPKDGPSAGITIATAILSVLTRRPVNRQVAMTGEITLRGTVLPIGGLKEKVLAAKIAGIERIVLPGLNDKELDELAEGVRAGLTFDLVEHMDGVLEKALLPIIAPNRRRGTAQGSGRSRSRKVAPPSAASTTP